MNSEKTRKHSKSGKAFIPFAVLGYPDEKASLQIIRAMVDGGADMLELGFPFSDPIADGPVIQEAASVALQAGVDTEACFKMLGKARRFTNMPIGLLVYFNLVMQYGVDAFYRKCRERAIQYVLVADVPLEEAGETGRSARKYGVGAVFIVSELTSNDRLRKVFAATTGFVYVVSRPGVTGVRREVSQSTKKLLERLRAKTTLPLYVGFGISKPAHVRAMCRAGADGVICGSAIVSLVKKNIRNRQGMVDKVRAFVRAMKAATINK